MKTADTRGGALVKATVIRDKDGKAKFSHAFYDTLFAAKPDGKSNYKVIPSWMPEKIPALQMNHFLIFRERGIKNFDKHNVNVPRLHGKSSTITEIITDDMHFLLNLHVVFCYQYKFKPPNLRSRMNFNL